MNEIDALSIVDTSLPATVKVALHALSMHENRKKFLPTLWTIPSGGLKAGQVLKQVRTSPLAPSPPLIRHRSGLVGRILTWEEVTSGTSWQISPSFGWL